MEIIRIALVGIIGAFAALIVREHRPDIAMLVSVVGGLIILASLVSYLGSIFAFLSEITSAANIDSSVLRILLKIVAIGYITDFSATLAEESGSKSMSEKIVLGGKLMIFVTSIPVIKGLFEMLAALLQ